MRGTKHTARLISSAVLLAAAVALAGCTLGRAASHADAPAPTLAPPAHIPPSAGGCPTPAPTTASGYATMFARVPLAGDVSISVSLGHRAVWLYGDSLTPRGFVHSAAITQDKGCLRLSHGGGQLLPNDNPAHIYWIESARVVDGSHLAVTARAVTLVGTGVWDFRDGGQSRIATVAVDRAGDVTFQRWGPRVASPAPDPGPWGPGTTQTHYVYARHTHPEAYLASGLTLVTWCQNWATLHPLADYQPIFSEE